MKYHDIGNLLVSFMIEYVILYDKKNGHTSKFYMKRNNSYVIEGLENCL